jgi:hypothetical protein
MNVSVLSGITEATELFKVWKTAKQNREQQESAKNDKKPAPFKFVRVGRICVGLKKLVCEFDKSFT